LNNWVHRMLKRGAKLLFFPEMVAARI